jgi:putative two-component system response regulator
VLFRSIFISDTILNKPGQLTSDEFEIMKTHVSRGVEAIQRLKKEDQDEPLLKYAEIVASAHHEKWDGSGYPLGLKGEDIPLLGRLMAIADVYDALTSKRPYKDPFPTDKAAKIIIEGSGTHFDPVLVAAFERIQDDFAAIAKSGALGLT